MTLSEAQIQRACCDLLVADGWRRIRTDPVSDRLRGKGFGERGMADDLYIRYSHMGHLAEVVWIEWKREDARGRATKVRDHQRLWHMIERDRGALTLIAGEDFPASIDGFTGWYRKSGLNRRIK